MNAQRLGHAFQLGVPKAMSVTVSLGQIKCVNGAPAQGGVSIASWCDVAHCDIAQAKRFKPVVEDGDIKPGIRGATTKPT